MEDIVNCFYIFDLDELYKIKNFDFKKIIQEVKKADVALNKCNYCGKKSKYYFCFGLTKNVSFSDEYTLSTHYGKFCSYHCFKRFIKEDINEVKYFKWGGNDLECRVIMSLQRLAQRHGLEKLDQLNLAQEIEKIIQQRRLEQNCDQCPSRKKKISLCIDNPNKRAAGSLTSGDFCSKKCMETFFKEKIKKISC